MSTTELGSTRRRAALASLADLLPGQVTLPGDPHWDEQRIGFSLSIDQQPIAVVAVQDEDDVVAVVRHAARHDLSVALQPTGHAATVAIDGTILLRTRALDEISVDLVRGTARVGAGVKWRELLAATSALGLTGLAGSNGDPSVVGYTLGGGLSWFGRAFGLAENSVLYFDIVDAQGRARRVSSSTDPDLFWAMRGGGGDFAAVVAMEILLHRVPQLCGGRMLWPIEMARPVLDAFEDVTRHAPVELTVWAQLLRFPDLPQLPKLMRGGAFIAIDVTFLGSPADADIQLTAFRGIPGKVVDTVGALAIKDLPTISAEPDDPSPSIDFSRFLTHLDSDGISALLTAVGPASGSSLIVVQLRHLGGALQQTTDADGPTGAIDEPYQLFCVGVPFTPDMAAEIEMDLATTTVAMRPYLSERAFFNFLGADDDPTRAFSEASLTRLRQIKRQCDPSGLFVSNRPVLGPRH